MRQRSAPSCRPRAARQRWTAREGPRPRVPRRPPGSPGSRPTSGLSQPRVTTETLLELSRRTLRFLVGERGLYVRVRENVLLVLPLVAQPRTLKHTRQVHRRTRIDGLARQLGHRHDLEVAVRVKRPLPAARAGVRALVPRLALADARRLDLAADRDGRLLVH